MVLIDQEPRYSQTDGDRGFAFPNPGKATGVK